MCHFIRKFINATINCDEDEHTEEFGAESIVVPIIFGIIFVVGFLGNLLVILIIAKNHKKKANRVFVLCLAICDMIFILFCVPFQAFIYTFPHWIFGRVFCKILHFCTELGSTGSVFSLVALSIDRNLAVSIFRAVRLFFILL